MVTNITLRLLPKLVWLLVVFPLLFIVSMPGEVVMVGVVMVMVGVVMVMVGVVMVVVKQTVQTTF